MQTGRARAIASGALQGASSCSGIFTETRN